MKKTLIAIVAAAFMAIPAHAQFGIIGGFTSSSSDVNLQEKTINTSNVNLYHVGLTYKLGLPLGLALQPSLVYQVKGASLENQISAGSVDLSSLEIGTNVGYLEVPVQVQWGVDLLGVRPYIFAEPFVGYALTNSVKINTDGIVGNVISGADFNDELKAEAEKQASESLTKLEYGYGLGVGVELLNMIQISAQWFTNLGGFVDENGQIDQQVVKDSMLEAYKDKSFGGFKLSLAILF